MTAFPGQQGYRRLLPALLLLLSFCCLPLAGCQSTYRNGGWASYGRSKAREMKPVLAVMDFENRSNFSGQYNLGHGMADLLVTDLIDSRRVTVLERKDLDDVVGEIVRQGRDLFRKEGRVEPGRLKNAKFLVRGTVTDFTVTSETSGWFGIPNFRARAGGSKARVALNIKVSDVETGEIISSVKTDASVGSGGFGADVNYKKVAFGGDAFFRTPLGRATESAIHKAVKKILRDLPTQYWSPRVAEAGPDMLVVNGGANVGVQAGDLFLVREQGRRITDPITGNSLENVPGRIVGKAQVRDVRELSAHATIIQGMARRGDILESLK